MTLNTLFQLLFYAEGNGNVQNKKYPTFKNSKKTCDLSELIATKKLGILITFKKKKV